MRFSLNQKMKVLFHFLMGHFLSSQQVHCMESDTKEDDTNDSFLVLPPTQLRNVLQQLGRRPSYYNTVRVRARKCFINAKLDLSFPAAVMAQWIKRPTSKREVGGSSPLGGGIIFIIFLCAFSFYCQMTICYFLCQYTKMK